MITLDEDIKEEDECALSHLSNDKSLGWDRISNEFVKASVQQLKGPLTIHEIWSH